MATHPDLLEMQARYEEASSSPPAVITDGLVLLAGVWLAISPWVIGFDTTAHNVTVSNLIVGIAVTVVALGLTLVPARMARLSWAMAAMGAWVVVSQWVILRGSAPQGMWLNNVITGGVICLLGIAAGLILMAGSRRPAKKAGSRYSSGEARRFESGESGRLDRGEPGRFDRAETGRHDAGERGRNEARDY